MMKMINMTNDDFGQKEQLFSLRFITAAGIVLWAILLAAGIYSIFA
ncbi:MAG: hypothetical protein U0K57_00570 [Lachnospiraceae bacterium]|nr:hypothetical protein [Lachnospiraceae bacterium]